MAKTTHDELLDHEYDGIREYDNPCPTWWHIIFFGSVVFSFFYFVFFHIGTAGWTVEEAYSAAQADLLKLKYAEIGELTGDQATLLEYMNKPKWMAAAAATYQTHCKSCHGDDGSGLVGPNLTDDYYKNVETLTDIVKVIQDGAAAGAMPAWRARLHPNDIVLVSAYVAGLRGENLPSTRPAEGEPIDPWPQAAAETPTEPAGE